MTEGTQGIYGLVVEVVVEVGRLECFHQTKLPPLQPIYPLCDIHMPLKKLLPYSVLTYLQI